MDKNRKDLENWYEDNKDKYKRLIKKCESIITDLVKDKEIAVNSITGRVKNKSSFCEKALKEKYKDPLNEITDMAGIRIITYVNSDVEKISKIIEEEFDVDKENSIDKGKLLGIDKVGYKSVHYVVKMSKDRRKLTEYKDFKNIYFEIQIRTLLQHAWSEIEHDRNYKFSGVLPAEIKRKFSLLAGNLELIDLQFEEISKQIDIYAKDIAGKVENGDLMNILIDSTSLVEYIQNKFEKYIHDNRLTVGGEQQYALLIEELKSFGVDTLEKLDQLISLKTEVEIMNGQGLLGVIRDYMMAENARKYFSDCWNNNWGYLDGEDVERFEKGGINLIGIIGESGIHVSRDMIEDVYYLDI